MSRSPALLLALLLSACASSPHAATEAPPLASVPVSSKGKADVETLRRCCHAIRASADALPPPKSFFAASVAERCARDVESVATEEDQDHLVATLRGELRGTPLPTACD